MTPAAPEVHIRCPLGQLDMGMEIPGARGGGMKTADRAILVEGRRHMREDPIMIAVARHVLHGGEDLALVLDRIPQELERRAA